MDLKVWDVLALVSRFPAPASADVYRTAEAAAAENSHLQLLFELPRFQYPGPRTGLPQHASLCDLRA
jgi:hypothetical protein